MIANDSRTAHPSATAQPGGAPRYVRVEGGLIPHRSIRPLGYVVRNSPRFRQRLVRQAGLLLTAPIRLATRLFSPVLALRMRCAFVRGLSRDRLDFLGEEYVSERLLPRVRFDRLGDPAKVVLVSNLPDHLVVPLARRLGVAGAICNQLEFRDGQATGRLRQPVLTGREPVEDLPEPFGLDPQPRTPHRRALVRFDAPLTAGSFSVPDSLEGRTLLVIGGTGFIGKVFLANLMRGLPGLAKVFLLIRPRGGRSAQQRFDRIRTRSPVLRELDPELLEARVEIVEGDASRPGLGLAEADRERLLREVDVVVNSGGVTEFNPDLRLALEANVEAALHVADFVGECADAGLVHLSTCFVAGRRAGRVPEVLEPEYNPAGRSDFDAEHERIYLRGLVAVEEEREPNRRRLRAGLARHGTERALHWGWPNTYTFTKSLAESLLARRAGDLRIAIVRPSIVETSTHEPFRGWNEGINTSAPLSYLLGTPFRQLPSNGRKRLDVIPVDSVTRGLVLICAAVAGRRNRHVYQLASSVTNPCDMRRSIELTCLAHRKHYREQRGLAPWWRTTCESIPVSKKRYENMSAPRQKAIVRALRRTLPFVRQPLRHFERSLDRVEKLIELYEPFILENDHAFEADRVELLSAALPPSERATFGYDASRVAWPEYWIDVHIPALRRWSYPLIEGRPIEG